MGQFQRHTLRSVLLIVVPALLSIKAIATSKPSRTELNCRETDNLVAGRHRAVFGASIRGKGTKVVCLIVYTMLAATAKVYPVEIGSPQHNPHKGWVYIDHAVPGEIDAGASVKNVRDGTPYEWYENVAVLSTWALVEREPDVYDWTLMDQAVDAWKGLGKTIHLRFSTEDFNVIPGCPRWLFNQGVPMQERAHLRFPDYRNPLYLERLQRFLGVLAERYGDDPRVETVNLQGYGNFGEWHSGYNYATVGERVDALRGIIDAWRGAFGGKTWLNLSVSYEWRAPNNVGEVVLPRGTSIYEWYPPSYQDYRHRSAFDYGLAFPEVTVSRHGVGGAVKYEYDGRLIANSFQLYRKPLYMEFFGPPAAYRGESIVGFAATRDGDDHVENAIDEMLSHHANFASPLGWGSFLGATEFYNDNHDLVLKGHKYLGYRFVLTEASYPEAVAPGAAWTFRHCWENRAVGRCYVQYPLAIYLMRGDRAIWSAVDTTFDQRNYVSGETYVNYSRFTMPRDIEPGTYDLRIAMVDANGDPALNLAIAGADDTKRYSLGRVTIKDDALPEPNATLVPVRRDGVRWVAESPLGPEAGYLVSFAYTATRDPVRDLNDLDNPGYFRVFVEGTEGERVGEYRWFDKAGQPAARKSLLFRTGPDSAYGLTWEPVGGGDMAIDDVRIEIVPNVRLLRVGREEFRLVADAQIEQQVRVRARRDQSQVTLPDDWYDYLATRTDRVALAPDTVYTVWFDSAVRPQLWQGDYAYLAVRSVSDPTDQCAFFRWTQRHTADPCRHAYTFRTGSKGDYALVWGIKNGGEIAVSNVALVQP